VGYWCGAKSDDQTVQYHLEWFQIAGKLERRLCSILIGGGFVRINLVGLICQFLRQKYVRPGA
jgi:hypothetical protein